MSDIHLTLREARGEDAAELLAVSQKIGQETDFWSWMKQASPCLKQCWHSN